MVCYGQLVIGPPGSGKSAYCYKMFELLKELGRKVAILNLDPANDSPNYTAAFDINDFVSVGETMNYMNLGPNGAVLFCMEFAEKYAAEIVERVKQNADHYFLIDCPGQVELYTHHDSLKNILKSFHVLDLRLCCVSLIDAHYCSDTGKFISAILLSLTFMLHLALPHVNILSKIDLMEKFGDKLAFNTDYYTEVLDLSYLIESVEDDAFSLKYQRLTKNLASLVEDFSLVQFLPMSVKRRQYLLKVLNSVDKANGYIFKCGEERTLQKLLSSFMSNEKIDVAAFTLNEK